MICYIMICDLMICDLMICYIMICYIMICDLMICYIMICYLMICYLMICYLMICYLMICYLMICDLMICYLMICDLMICYLMLSYLILSKFTLLHSTYSPYFTYIISYYDDYLTLHHPILPNITSCQAVRSQSASRVVVLCERAQELTPLIGKYAYVSAHARVCLFVCYFFLIMMFELNGCVPILSFLLFFIDSFFIFVPIPHPLPSFPSTLPILYIVTCLLSSQLIFPPLSLTLSPSPSLFLSLSLSLCLSLSLSLSLPPPFSL